MSLECQICRKKKDKRVENFFSIKKKRKKKERRKIKKDEMLKRRRNGKWLQRKLKLITVIERFFGEKVWRV